MSLEPGDHGSTFGGNPLTTAAAYASTKYIVDHDMSANALAMGERLMAGLEGLKSRFDFISQVRGMGLLVALEFDGDIAAKVVAQSNEDGLLLNPVRPNAIRFMPPLNVSAGEIDEGVERLATALGKI
jgi:acetylornithine/N-succinyldiaminopimelate aminotransferase